MIENISYSIGLCFFIFFLKLYGDYAEIKGYSEGVYFPYILVYILVFIGICFTLIK